MIWFVGAGWHAEKQGASDSQSTVSVTSTWCWSPTSRVQGISCAWVLKEAKPRGWAWAVTGGKIGNPMQFWWARPSLLGLPAVTVAPQPLGTWHHLIGSLDKPSRARISESKKKENNNTLNIFESFVCFSFFPASNFPLFSWESFGLGLG